nr:HWE histidine kinase domain-containing protein [Pararoseomonas indoligenes]
MSCPCHGGPRWGRANGPPPSTVLAAGGTVPPGKEVEGTSEPRRKAGESHISLSEERDALAAENRLLRADARSQAAARGELLRRVSDAEARVSAREESLRASGEALRISLAEARLLAESLEVANTALTLRNSYLEDGAAARVAELEAANDALRRDEEHLRLVFESATEYAIFTLDLEGRVTSWNPGAQRILGYGEDEIVGQPAHIIVTPEDRAARRPEIEMSRAVEHCRARDERWHLRADGSRFWAVGMLMPLLSRNGDLQGFLKILRDHTERREHDERLALLNDELTHRVKNTLAAVQSVAAHTLRGSDLSVALQSTLVERLKALGRSHDLLVWNRWEGALLNEVLERTLEAYGSADGARRFSMAGPSVRLSSDMTVTLNLALHELATNAAKYGALSVAEGSVDVRWELERSAQEQAPAVVMTWRERGGPPVRPPGRRGFGSRMLERALPYQSGGQVTLSFAPEGVECHLRLPIAPPPPGL